MKIIAFLKRILLGLIIVFFIFIVYFSTGNPPKIEKISWGINFSQKHTQFLELDWKETYLAILDDLNVKNIKLSVNWDLIESEKDKFNFADLDWQIQEAQDHDARILLVIGMKTGRWPECHIPIWAKNLAKEEQQKEISQMLKEIVLRYRDSETIKYWQVENEPFFPFGECPWVDKKFLKEEVALVKSLDSKKRPIIVSDSGEGSFWINAARFGDIVGTTMYEKVWFRQLNSYIRYPFPPTFYWRKAEIIKKLFAKKVICIEFQAEPWGPELLYSSPIVEQEKTMNPEQFRENIEFAKKTGLDEFYFWGTEWWYWMKTTKNQPEIWNEAKTLFQ